MTLSTKDIGGSGGGFSGIEIADGVHVEKTKIKGVKDLSGKILDYINDKFDLAIEVIFDEPDVSFDPSIRIFGNFKREGGNVVGWGSAFKVGRFFKNISGEDLNLTEQYRIPKPAFQKVLGIAVAKLTFEAGRKKDDPTKKRFITWDLLVSLNGQTLEEAAEIMKEQWDYQRSKGYPKEYAPSKSGGGQRASDDDVYMASTDNSAPATKTSAKPDPAQASAGSFDADDIDDEDDIPF